METRINVTIMTRTPRVAAANSSHFSVPEQCGCNNENMKLCQSAKSSLTKGEAEEEEERGGGCCCGGRAGALLWGWGIGTLIGHMYIVPTIYTGALVVVVV